jgi:hypothetical protein
MPDRWWSRSEWDDTDAEADPDGTHTCRVCGHAATIQTPQRRTEHYCRECDAFRRFVSTLTDAYGP